MRILLLILLISTDPSHLSWAEPVQMERSDTFASDDEIIIKYDDLQDLMEIKKTTGLQGICLPLATPSSSPYTHWCLSSGRKFTSLGSCEIFCNL